MDELTPLLRAAQGGDRLALASFIRRSQAEVWRLCAYLVDRQAADDLTQEVYLRAWTALPAWRGQASARTWLLAIARRTCAQAIRRHRWPLLPPVEPAADDPVVPDSEEVVLLHQLVAGLDPQRRAAFALTQLLGLTYAEAAEICGCPVGTIRSRVARARADLTIQLRDGGLAPASANTPISDQPR
jgi:RNA polymerase sigma-70 factor (ECF subfamily)